MALQDRARKSKTCWPAALPALTAGGGWGEIEADLSYYLGPITVGKADGEGTLLFKTGLVQGTVEGQHVQRNRYAQIPTGEVYEDSSRTT